MKRTFNIELEIKNISTNKNTNYLTGSTFGLKNKITGKIIEENSNNATIETAANLINKIGIKKFFDTYEFALHENVKSAWQSAHRRDFYSGLYSSVVSWSLDLEIMGSVHTYRKYNNNAPSNWTMFYLDLFFRDRKIFDTTGIALYPFISSFNFEHGSKNKEDSTDEILDYFTKVVDLEQTKIGEMLHLSSTSSLILASKEQEQLNFILLTAPCETKQGGSLDLTEHNNKINEFKKLIKAAL